MKYKCWVVSKNNCRWTFTSSKKIDKNDNDNINSSVKHVSSIYYWHCCAWAPFLNECFTNMDQIWSQLRYVITCQVKCRMKLLIPFLNFNGCTGRKRKSICRYMILFGNAYIEAVSTGITPWTWVICIDIPSHMLRDSFNIWRVLRHLQHTWSYIKWQVGIKHVNHYWWPASPSEIIVTSTGFEYDMLLIPLGIWSTIAMTNPCLIRGHVI